MTAWSGRAQADDAQACVPTARAAPLSEALRERTRELHVEAERSGIVREILRGRATRYGYALLLRNLVPAYEHLERALEAQPSAAVGAMAMPELYRSGALRADLAGLYGPQWHRSLALLPAGERYGHRVAAAGRGDGARLIGHAYARYLGDLSGGRILRRLLARSLGLGPAALSLYDFPAIAEPEAFKAGWRQTLDRVAGAIDDVEDVVEEAAVAFALNIEVSRAVRRAVADDHPGTLDGEAGPV